MNHVIEHTQLNTGTVLKPFSVNTSCSEKRAIRYDQFCPGPRGFNSLRFDRRKQISAFPSSLINFVSLSDVIFIRR